MDALADTPEFSSGAGRAKPLDNPRIATALGVLLGIVLLGALVTGAHVIGAKHPPQLANVTAMLTIAHSDPARRMGLDWNAYTVFEDKLRLPVLTKEGRVFDLFRRPADLPPQLAGEAQKPVIALLVLGLGFDDQASQSALAALPFDAGVGLAPTAPYKDNVIKIARSSGRELWVHLPSESLEADRDEGGTSLQVNAPATLNIGRLNEGLGALTHYVGVMLSPGTKLTGAPQDLDPVIAELGKRGLGFAKLSPAPSAELAQVTANARVPLVPFALPISDTPLPDAVRARLDDVLRMARESGYALAVITEPNPIVLKETLNWIALHQNTDFALVPPSAIALAAQKQ